MKQHSGILSIREKFDCLYKQLIPLSSTEMAIIHRLDVSYTDMISLVRRHDESLIDMTNHAGLSSMVKRYNELRDSNH